MASSAFSVDLYELTILPKCHARLEAQVITYAISQRECCAIARRGCNAISRRECFAIPLQISLPPWNNWFILWRKTFTVNLLPTGNGTWNVPRGERSPKGSASQSPV